MGEPAWAIATLFPDQGLWKEEDYLGLSVERRFVELVNGKVEVLPMPTDRHQSVLKALFLFLHAYMRPLHGVVQFAGLRVRVGPGLFRQPDVVVLSAAKAHLRADKFWSGADLVVEVVSGSAEDSVRDLVTKRTEYAEAGIAEYWIAQPEEETLTVLRLEAGHYVEHGVFGRGTTATSALFDGLSFPLDEVFDAD